MPDEPSGSRDELAALRAASARLRQVVQAKDTEIAALCATLEAGQGRQAELIRRLELRIAELERRLGMDSGNSSTPPTKEQPAAKARRKAARRASQRERSKERRPGGQPGHQGSGLEPAREPDRTEWADPPIGVPLMRGGPGRRRPNGPGLGRRSGWRRCAGCCRRCAAVAAGR